MSKITIFTNHYQPESFRINEISKKFSENNDVSVICQVPNYPNGDFYPGYSNRKNKEEVIDDIKIKRLFTIPRKQSSFMLVLNYLSYMLSTMFYGRFSKDKTDHVYVYVTSPIFLAYGALNFAKRNKVKSTLYLLDLWPESLFSILKIENNFIKKVFNKKINKLYHRFDNIIVGSESFKDSLIKRGVSEDKITYLPQHADEILAKPIEISKEDHNLKIVFTGNMGSAQGLDILVDSIEILDKENINNVIVTMVGDGRNRINIENIIKKKNLEKYFNFVGRVKQEEVINYLKDNHLGFVSLKDIDPLNKTLPAKVQSYMSYGIPILSCGSPETKRLIDKVNCGISSDGNALDLSEVIKYGLTLSENDLKEMGYNGNKYSKAEFDINILVAKMLKIMKEGQLDV